MDHLRNPHLVFWRRAKNAGDFFSLGEGKKMRGNWWFFVRRFLEKKPPAIKEFAMGTMMAMVHFV